MKYRRAWLLAFVCVLIDGGMTYAALEAGVAHEANPVMLDAMEEFGVEQAIVLSILTRFVAFTVAIVVQELAYKFDWLLPLVIVPVAVAPVLWNTWVLLPVILL